MRKIHLISVETQQQEAGQLESKVDEIQKTSAPNLRIGLGYQIAAKGRIQWEVISKDIESLRTKLDVFCAREDMRINKCQRTVCQHFCKWRRGLDGVSKANIQNKH